MVSRLKKADQEEMVGQEEREKRRELKSPWFPQLCAEAGAYGGRVFKT